MSPNRRPEAEPRGDGTTGQQRPPAPAGEEGLKSQVWVVGLVGVVVILLALFSLVL
jgi:hypothetical protein